MRQINDAGLELIQKFEGMKLAAYRCPAGVLTIGYGHTGPDVREGLTISEADADRLLLHDLDDAERIVEAYVTAPLNDNQFSALASFVFNVGPGEPGVKNGFVYLKEGGPSTLLKLVNAGNYRDASFQFTHWVRVAGRACDGLVRRRMAEQELFNKPAEVA